MIIFNFYFIGQLKFLFVLQIENLQTSQILLSQKLFSCILTQIKVTVFKFCSQQQFFINKIELI